MMKKISVTIALAVVSLIAIPAIATIWDNTAFVLSYDGKKYARDKAETQCQNKYQTTLATITEDTFNEKVTSLYPFVENSTDAQECWIGLEYRLIDVYTPFYFLVSVYVNETNTTNVTIPLEMSYNELYVTYEESNMTDSDSDDTQNVTYVLCQPLPVNSSNCTAYNTAEFVSTLNVSNSSNITEKGVEYCFLAVEFPINETEESKYNTTYRVCQWDVGYNYSNYYGFIWAENSSLSYENWYNYSFWNRDGPVVPTMMPTEPPTDINGTFTWSPPTLSPTDAPTVLQENYTFCVSVDMQTGQWFSHKDCSSKLECFICDTNIDIRSNGDYVFHYDLTDDQNLQKNWNDADQFCRDNYKTKLASVRDKSEDILAMSLIFSMTDLNFTEHVENLTSTYEAAIRARNDSEELATLPTSLAEYYYEIEWLQSQNTFFRSNKHTTESIWIGLYGYVLYDESCYDLNTSEFNASYWGGVNATLADFDEEWIEENLLDIDYCNWTLNFSWIDNAKDDFSWGDFSWPTRNYPEISQRNWATNEYYGDYSPENMSCVAVYYNQSSADWSWDFYPCYGTDKISWFCDAPERRFAVQGDTSKSETSHDSGTRITTSAILVTLIFILPITVFITIFCIKYYLYDKSGDFVIDCVDFLICTKCRSNYQRQKAAETGNLLTSAKVKNTGLAGWLGVNFSVKLSAVAAYAEDTETQEYLYEIHWPKEAQFWGHPSHLNELEYFIRLSSRRTMARVWKVFIDDDEDEIVIKDTWSRVMYCWLAMFLIEKDGDKVEAPPSYDRVRPIFDKISYELTHFLPKKQKEFMSREDYMDNFRRWLYKICRRRQILLKRYRPKVKKERERLELDDPNRPKDSNSSDEEPPILWNPGSIIFSDVKAKNKRTFDSDESEDDDDDDDDDESNSKRNDEDYDSEDEYENAKKKNKKIEHQFSTRQVVPMRKDISMVELQTLGSKKNVLIKQKNGDPQSRSEHEVAPLMGLDLEDILASVDDE